MLEIKLDFHFGELVTQAYSQHDKYKGWNKKKGRKKYELDRRRIEGQGMITTYLTIYLTLLEKPEIITMHYCCDV